MTDTFKNLAAAMAPAATAAVYTVPATTQAIVREIRVVNTDSVARTITLFSNGSAAVNQIRGATTLQPGETMEVECYITMAAADTIQALGSAAAVLAINIFGLQIS